MKQQKHFLKPNVVVEPLVDSWYAWAHLIPPATAARNLTERHMRIMDSYISSPETHAAAVKNPKLLGGPFMDLEGNQADAVTELRDRTQRERAGLLELSKAIEELDRRLQAEAQGFDIVPIYKEVPEALRGYVELVYDLNNHPSFRLLEPLLYRSPYYDPSMQSLMLSTVTGDDRPFVLSTPRFENCKNVHLKMPFASERVDRLFQWKTQPASLTEIRDTLDLGDQAAERFKTFLTEEPGRRYQSYDGKGARWRYFGHACILLETKGLSILIDPVLSYTYESDISRYTYEDLPDTIDYVLITHNHQDHILFETLLQLRHKIKTIVVPRNGGGALHDPSLRLTLQNCGFRNVVELSEMDELEVPTGSITAIPFFGEHGDLSVQTKTAYVVRINGHSVLFAADSRNVQPETYAHVHKLIGDVEVMFLGMECDGAPMSWIYGPLLTAKMDRKMDQSRRLSGSNFEQGIRLVDEFRCKDVYVYAMGQEPWLNYVMSIKYTEQSNPIIQSNMLIEECRKRGLVAERLFGEKEILLP
jgi:L-ascorbate metabolism protein UlaG (beta-lactamase superfamily)